MLAPAVNVLAQYTSTPAVYHNNTAGSPRTNAPSRGRHTKVRMNFGFMLKQFYNTDPHYTSNTTGNGGYDFGLKLEIPALRNSSILVGAEFIKHSFTFNSYYFAPGYSFLYDGNLIYNHAISYDEVQIPIEYKFPFKNEIKNIKTFYGVLGWIYRISAYNNVLVTNTQKGSFVWEGQDDISPVYPFLFSQGSTALELGIGFQHNTLRSGNAWFIEIDYKYGFSPLLYTGNTMGSNSVQFTLNTLAFKIGMKL